jgi:hypothetical protein
LYPIGVLIRIQRRPVSVIELTGYRRRADELLTAAEQAAVVDLIAYEPTCGDLIPGTGGLRKVRVGRGGAGKRGGARVVYSFYDAAHPILLLALYAKSERGDLTAAEKKEFAAFAEETARQWTARRKRR